MEITVLLLLANSASSSWRGADETLLCLACDWWLGKCHRSTCLPRHSIATSRVAERSIAECAPTHVPAAPDVEDAPPGSMPDRELHARAPALVRKRQSESSGAITQIDDCDNGLGLD